MSELNGKRFKVWSDDRKQFKIDCDTRKYNDYKDQGVATEVKLPILAKFSSFEKSLYEKKERIVPDMSKFFEE